MKLSALAFWNLRWGSGTEVDQKRRVFEKINRVAKNNFAEFNSQSVVEINNVKFNDSIALQYSRSFWDQFVCSIVFRADYLTVFTRTNNMADYPTDYYEKLARKLAVMKKEDNARTDKKSIEYIEDNGSRRSTFYRLSKTISELYWAWASN